MDLEKLITKRKTLRTAFTECSDKITATLSKKVIDMNELTVLQSQLIAKFERLKNCQIKISNANLSSDKHSKEDYENDVQNAERFKDNFCGLLSQIDNHFIDPENGESVLDKDTVEKRQSKLPKIELKKFSGDVKEFSSFWAQFEKIHLDNNMSSEDKFKYLLQSIVPKSKAARLIGSLSVTASNYQKAISQLKEHFSLSRDDLLVQIYVRDLLRMVMKNAISGRKKTNNLALYNELQAKIRALESLGRTQEEYSDFLIPLVECCLPEELLLAWERSCNSKESPKPEDCSLENLMNFIQKAAKGEGMVELSHSESKNNINGKKNEQINKSTDPPSASKLTNTSNANIPDKEATQQPTKKGSKKKGNKSQPKCGLCGSSEKKLTKTECCNNWICDDADTYVLFSYARNSCYRNHDRYTLCSYHFNESHPGRWQDCQKCKDEFDTPNYVTFGTNYNFEPLENPEKFSVSCAVCGFTSGTLDSFPLITSKGSKKLYYCAKKKCQKVGHS